MTRPSKKKKTISKKLFLFISVIYLPLQPSWWGLMVGLGLWRRRPSDVSCVTLQVAAQHQSPHHLPSIQTLPSIQNPVFRAQRLSISAPRNPNPSSIRHRAYRVSHIKDDTSRGTKDRTAQLPMWQQEWHLWHHCPLQFVINHAQIVKYFFHPPQPELFIPF